MNGSIQTLLVILVLVGGALETNSMDEAETSQRVVPDEEAKKLCFQFLKNELENYILLDDVKLMLERLFEENRRELNFDKSIAKIALHDTPISCLKLVDFVEKVVNANDNCRWLDEYGTIMDQVLEVSHFDMRTSEMYLAYKVCDRLATLEIKKVNYQSVHEAFLESYKRMSIPSVEVLIAESIKARGDVKKSKELAIICEGILDKKQEVVKHMMKSRPDSEEKFLFDQIALAESDRNLDAIKDNYKAVRFCSSYLRRRKSRFLQFVTKGT